ncbi:MAG: outer membrane beta-barrel protein [Vicinamibacterales bacterium]
MNTTAWATRILIIAVAALLSLPALAAAQDPVTSFDRLVTRLEVGDTVWVTDVRGREIKGTVQEIQPSAITIDSAGPVTFQAGDVRLIAEEAPRRVARGTLIGAAIGGGSGAVIGYLGSDAAASWTSALAGIGAGAGAGIGAAVVALKDDPRRLVVYRAPAPPGEALQPVAPAAPAPGEAATGVAQPAGEPRLQLAATVGISTVLLGTSGGSLAGVSYGARAGYRVNNSVSIGAEFGLHGVNDEEPQDSDVALERRPKVAQTRMLLGYVQFNSGSFYVRPAFGLGFHSFGFYGPRTPDCTGDDCWVAEEGMEGGLALSVAAGWTWRLSRRVGLAAEGLFIASGGEDSTSSRNVLGVQFGPVFSF